MTFVENRNLRALRSRVCVFLNSVIPAAPDVPIQIANLAGAGGYQDPDNDAALGVFADAIGARDGRMKQVFFDISGVFLKDWEPKAGLVAKRLRTIGLDRILYGLRRPALGELESFSQTSADRGGVPDHQRNVAPYLR